MVAARSHGASGATRPLVSTVIKPDADNFLEESLDRCQYVASETPQAFQIPILSRAYKKVNTLEKLLLYVCCNFNKSTLSRSVIIPFGKEGGIVKGRFWAHTEFA